jgi:long-chain acyl-CoA synthetase
MTAVTHPPSAPTSRPLAQAGDRSLRPPELTVPVMLRQTVSRHPHKAVILYKEGGEYRPITYAEMEERVRRLALGLMELGIEPGTRVALLSENRPEWAIADLAILSIGAVNVPLYSTLPPPQVEYIVGNAGAQVLIVSNSKQLDKALEVCERLSDLKWIIAMDPPDEPPEGVLSLSDVDARGGAAAGGREEFQRRADAVRPGDLATIIYTSGTTGAPKGAMLTHDNFMSNAQSVAKLVHIEPYDLFLSFLPLSHVFERMAGQYLPLYVGATVAYAESVFTVQTNMVEVKPTVMASVPRLYESLHSRIEDGIAKQPEKRRKMAEWAIRIGKEYNVRRFRGERVPLLTSLLYRIADRLVLAPLRERVTGGQLRFFISGGAPLPVATAEFVTALGLQILEGYGLTETSPVISVNLPHRTKLGMVGPPIAGVEVRIAADGEILSRGPHIMQGYYNMPEATAQAIDPEGWFHTGDIGVLDEENYLKITDRKKDILVLANGKNVAPQPIEAKLKASPYIANSVLFGDRQPQVVALIIPDFDHLKAWAREQKIEEREIEELVKRPEVKKLYRAEIDRLTADLADFEKIRRFTLLTRDFSQDQDELTPTLKVKRRVVAEHYAADIQAMYGGRGEGGG